MPSGNGRRRPEHNGIHRVHGWFNWSGGVDRPVGKRGGVAEPLENRWIRTGGVWEEDMPAGKIRELEQFDQAGRAGDD
jgi:hypothetical protein